METEKHPNGGADSKREVFGGLLQRVTVAELIGALKGATAFLEKGGGQCLCSCCQTPIESAQPFCPGCGVLLRFECPRCKRECLQGHAFCAACGFKLTQETVADLTAAKAREEEEKQRQALADSIAAKARQEEEKQRQAKDLLGPFTDIEEMGEDRCLKLRARRRDTGELRFLKKAIGVESRTFLENEAGILSTLSHPQLIKLHGLHQHRDQMLLELEYVEEARLRFPLDIERLCRIMFQLAEGLAALHERGLLHGDVKPQNILFRGGARPERDALVLCDLEFAQKPGPSRFKAMTPLFSAPEQIVGDHVDFRADVYAFGVVFYLWFFYDRLPAILDEESSAHRTMGSILGTAPILAGTPLIESTLIEEASSLRLTPRTTLRDGAAFETEVLGAKYHFTAELERITNVNKRLDLTGEILKLVSDATELDRAKRPPDGRALMERIERLLRNTEVAPVV